MRAGKYPYATEPAGSAWAARAQGHMAVLATCPLLFGGHTRSGAADYKHFHDVWLPSQDMKD